MELADLQFKAEIDYSSDRKRVIIEFPRETPSDYIGALVEVTIHPTQTIKKVRVKYWQQETMESGRYCFTSEMSEGHAKKLLESDIYEQATIEEA